MKEQRIPQGEGQHQVEDSIAYVPFAAHFAAKKKKHGGLSGEGGEGTAVRFGYSQVPGEQVGLWPRETGRGKRCLASLQENVKV